MLTAIGRKFMSIEPTLALKKLIGSRLAASPDVTDLVPADNILDRNGLPELDRCVLIGPGQVAYDEFKLTAYADLHVWVKESGLATANQIAGAVRAALKDRPWVIAGYFASDVRITTTRFMRDPGGEFSHGVVTVRSIMQERS